VWRRLVTGTWSLRSSFTLIRKLDQPTTAMRLLPEACSSSTHLQLKMGELSSPHQITHAERSHNQHDALTFMSLVPHSVDCQSILSCALMQAVKLVS